MHLAEQAAGKVMINSIWCRASADPRAIELKNLRQLTHLQELEPRRAACPWPRRASRLRQPFGFDFQFSVGQHELLRWGGSGTPGRRVACCDAMMSPSWVVVRRFDAGCCWWSARPGGFSSSASEEPQQLVGGWTGR